MGPLLELGITLPRRGSRRRLRALYEQLRAAILGGRLHPGLRLPSSRALAAGCGVARATVVVTYERLLAEGYLVARPGAGTFVAHGLPASAAGRLPSAVPAATAPDRRLAPAWRRAGGGAAAPDPRPRHDFRVGVPDRAAFPHDLWRRLLGRAARGVAATGDGYGQPEGREALRAGIASHVSLTRAVACHADDVIVTAGAQQAFDLLARVLVTPGRTLVAVEDPGYPPLRAALRAAGARLVPVPVDEAGLIVERVPREARVICVTPSHQFPVGAVMSLERRTALLALARTRGAVIVEDDYDSEFRFGGRPLDALQTLDRAGAVLYVGTFSKSLAPALRTGFIVTTPWAHAALLAAKRLSDLHNPTVIQDALALLISEGHLARHVRRMRRLYERRRELLLAALARDFARWLEPAASVAGLHLTAWLAPRADAEGLARRARQRGVGLLPLTTYYLCAARRQGLILGYGDIPESEIGAGLERLRSVFRP
jgi:GntR family transcriptional regulator / MocR family aminotransferase